MAAMALVMAAGAASPQTRVSPDYLAPFVGTPQPVVDKMLEAAEIKPGETLYDLGCGDGRILFTAAQKFRANAVGVELSAKLVKQATDSAAQLGLQKRIKVIQGNLLEVDLRGADVVTLYLLTTSNAQLKPNLQSQLKPGARVVSHDYPIKGWKPQRVEKVFVHQREHTIYVYRMPPQE
jgi:protein-L-isoaspartate O-methyltransferase